MESDAQFRMTPIFASENVLGGEHELAVAELPLLVIVEREPRRLAEDLGCIPGEIGTHCQKSHARSGSGWLIAHERTIIMRCYLASRVRLVGELHGL